MQAGRTTEISHVKIVRVLRGRPVTAWLDIVSSFKSHTIVPGQFKHISWLEVIPEIKVKCSRKPEVGVIIRNR